MLTGSKILFVEDETNLDATIIDALEKAELITGDILDRQELNHNGAIVFATSFEDAFKRIVALGDGSEYEWIFLDRNLEKYSDIPRANDQSIKIGDKEFTFNFFQGLNSFAGDYLFCTLVNAGVPLEKICFLTANDNDDSIKALETSPYLHKKRLPEIIAKTQIDELVNKLHDSHKAKIRFLYRDVFNNEKVKEVFGLYIEDFIKVLAKRYKEGCYAKYNKGNGILLRNMIESLVMCLSADPEQRVRAHLTKAPKYSVKYWWARKNYDAIQKYRNEHPEAREQEDRKILVEKILPSNWDTDRKEQEIELYNEYMSGMEKDFYQECPQYIFSYTDCIYTVTSEFSAHGKNDRTTDDLSIDGWEALLSGMLQIMQWVADKNPNS